MTVTSTTPTVSPAASTTRTFDDVELCATGTWNASTGETTITRADLEAILAAANDVDEAPLKLGHLSSLNEGEPAYGWVRPTHIARRNGRDVLLGRLSDVPAKLADVMRSAYRRRSVEIGWKVKGLSGQTHRAALVGLALLGVQAPAVKGLAPLDAALALYSGEFEIVDGGHVETVSFAEHDPEPVQDADHEGDLVTTEDLNARLQQMSDDDLRAALGARLGTLAPSAPTAAQTATPEPDQTSTPVEPVSPGNPGTPVESTAPVADPAPVAADPAPVAPARDPELVGALSDGPVVQMSRAQYDALSASAARAEQVETEGFLDELVRTGRVAPAERAWAAAQVSEHGAAAKAMLSGLQPRYAVSELGADNAQNVATDGPDWDSITSAPAFGR